MTRRRVVRAHRHTLRGLPPARPVGAEPAGTPGLTIYQGRTARGIATGNQLITRHQVIRGDQ